MSLALSIIALVIALMSALAAGLAVRWARRSALAAERATEIADSQRRKADTPRLEFRAYFDTHNHHGGGPCIELRTLDRLDDVALTLIPDPQGRWRDEPHMALSGTKDQSEPLRLGPMGVNEVQHVQIARNGKIEGLTLRLSVDCQRGADCWQLPLSATFPERDGFHIY